MYGEENIIAAIVHNDETTPHMHLNLMPVTKDGRLCSKQLFDKPQLQTDFYESVGKRWGLQRGKEGSQKKHLSTAEFKAKKIIEQAEAIRKENQVYADALKEAKGGEIPRKRGRLQEQVIALTAENKDLTARLDKNTIYRGFEPVSFRCRLYFCSFSGRKIVKIRLIPLKLNTLQG